MIDFPSNIFDLPHLRGKTRIFRSREDAGELLAEMLAKYREEHPIILAIPAGGVPVGKKLAEKLRADFDLIFVRKLQIPWEPEAGFGAVSSNGTLVLNSSLVEELGISEKDVKEVCSKVVEEIKKRIHRFKDKEFSLQVQDRLVILVDDGLASGYTMLAALGSIRRMKPKKVLVAIPTSSLSALKTISDDTDEVYCLNVRDELFYAVADAYIRWHDLSDDEVMGYIEDQ